MPLSSGASAPLFIYKYCSRLFGDGYQYKYRSYLQKTSFTSSN